MSLSVPNPCTNTKTYYAWMRSSLHWIVISRRRKVKYLQGANDRLSPQKQENYGVIPESYGTLVSLNLLGYDCHWRQQYPYGIVLPSLRLYPLVGSLFDRFDDLIPCGSIQEIQQAFGSGLLHPWTVDTFGTTLLHVLHVYSRLDAHS
jgi:hypothetical protein